MKRFLTTLLSLGLLTCFYNVFAQEGELLFKNVCAVCHTISKGTLVGPDLANVHQKRSEAWLLQFIKSSQTMVQSGDEDAVAIFTEFNQVVMPDVPYTEAEIKLIIEFIASQNPEMAAVTEKSTEQVTDKAEEVVETGRTVNDATEEEIVIGRFLFTGEKRLEGGGPACISCHNVVNDKIIGGGLLGKDLTDVFTRMNEAGIKAILGAPPFPVMKEAYKGSVVSEDEAYYLTAFLKYADQEQYFQHPRNYKQRFLYSGLGGVIFLLVVYGFVWRKRRKRKISHDIYKRQVASESSFY